MLLQPQSLAQHLLQGGVDGFVFVAGDGFDLGLRRAQPGFQGVGGIEQTGEGALAWMVATRVGPCQGQDENNGRDADGGHNRKSEGDHTRDPDTGGQSEAAWREGQIPRPTRAWV